MLGFYYMIAVSPLPHDAGSLPRLSPRAATCLPSWSSQSSSERILHGKHPSQVEALSHLAGLGHLSVLLHVARHCSRECPAPLWVSDPNFTTWKDYMLIPLVFVAGRFSRRRIGRAVRTVILITAIYPACSSTEAAYWRACREAGPPSTRTNAMAAPWLMARIGPQHSWLSSPCSSGASNNS